MSEVKQHAFSPTTAGMTCNEIQYPEWVRCGKAPDDPIHDGTRPEPPELEYPYPPCSLCGEDTYHDGDSLRCDPCGALWGTNGPGKWMEPELKACGSTSKPFDRPDLGAESIRHHVDHCIREADHDGKHRSDPFSEWDSEVSA